jgi:hypothetical protein
LQEVDPATGEKHKPDLFRETPLRFAGYANEVGEAFRPLIPRWMVAATYGVALVYAASDVADKVHTAATNKQRLLALGKSVDREKSNVRVGVETGVWQLLVRVNHSNSMLIALEY